MWVRWSFVAGTRLRSEQEQVVDLLLYYRSDCLFRLAFAVETQRQRWENNRSRWKRGNPNEAGLIDSALHLNRAWLWGVGGGGVGIDSPVPVGSLSLFRVIFKAVMVCIICGWTFSTCRWKQTEGSSCISLVWLCQWHCVHILDFCFCAQMTALYWLESCVIALLSVHRALLASPWDFNQHSSSAAKSGK